MQNKLVSTKIHGCLALKNISKCFCPGRRRISHAILRRPLVPVALLQSQYTRFHFCKLIQKKSGVPRILQTRGASRESAPWGSRTPGETTRTKVIPELRVGSSGTRSSFKTRSEVGRTAERRDGRRGKNQEQAVPSRVFERSRETPKRTNRAGRGRSRPSSP